MEKQYTLIPLLKPLKEAIRKGKPLETEIKEILKDFNDYSLEKDIQQRGKDTVLEEIEKGERFYNDERFAISVSQGVGIAQNIYSFVRIENIPIYILYAGKITDARAPRNGLMLNLGNILKKNKSEEERYEQIKSITAHESVHRFLDQLGLDTKKDGPYQDQILNSLWEEGLTTLVQTVHYPWHEDFVNDVNFWLKMVKEYLKDGTNEKQKEEIYQRCLNRKSCRDWMVGRGEWFREYISSPKDIDERFVRLLKTGNGPLYHMGYVLWKDQLKKGKDISQLVKGGHAQARDWLREYQEKAN